MAKDPATNVIAPAKLLLAVAKWAYQDADRPNINQVMFGAGEIAAVDGHRLVRVPIECEGSRFGIRPNLLTAAVQAVVAAHGSRNVEITHPAAPSSAGSCTVRGMDGVRSTSSLVVRVANSNDHEFPPLDAIMPTRTDAISPDGYGFNPAYLAAIAEVQEAADETGDRICKISGWSKDHCGAMLFEGKLGIRYVIMPGRVE